jgi:hypothetical protein
VARIYDYVINGYIGLELAKVATQTAPRKWDVLLEDAILKSSTSGPRTSAGGQSQGITGYEYTQGQQQYALQLQDAGLQNQPDFSQIRNNTLSIR